MRLAGFDARLLPGGALLTDAGQAERVAKLWQADLKGLAVAPADLERLIADDKIRAAFILGENPAAAERFNHFVNNLEFLVVGDLFLTETARAADVFLPLASCFETDGNVTNWCGVSQELHAIGQPVSGLSTGEIINHLARVAGQPIVLSAGGVTSEMETLTQGVGHPERLNGRFLTGDGKAHLGLYSEQMVPSGVLSTQVLAIDTRMNQLLKPIIGA
jgi:predicted molibdopterin-dependent oxidoreductase YjgC